MAQPGGRFLNYVPTLDIGRIVSEVAKLVPQAKEEMKKPADVEEN